MFSFEILFKSDGNPKIFFATQKIFFLEFITWIFVKSTRYW